MLPVVVVRTIPERRRIPVVVVWSLMKVVVVVLLVSGMEIAFGLALLFLIVGWLCSIRCRKKAHKAQYTSKDIPVTE